MKAFSRLRPFRSPGQPSWTQLSQSAPTVRKGLPLAIRTLTTESPPPAGIPGGQSGGFVTDELKIPFQGVTHARPVPTSPSYFSREPQFNDLYLDVTKLLTKYNHLPTIPNSEAPQLPWTKLPLMRAELGEQVKSAHFAKVMRVAKRLNLIEPSLRPAEVSEALTRFTRGIDHRLNVSTTIRIDTYGRALGVGRRKASTARAFIVEGTGEVFVNGKPITDVFGRAHDRESVLWALLATARMDKYNVWAMVEGGGTTGQAEALAMAVAKGLLGHEPALKPALKRAGVITRDNRTVERKKHGRVKARKAPAWVKR